MLTIVATKNVENTHNLGNNFEIIALGNPENYNLFIILDILTDSLHNDNFKEIAVNKAHVDKHVDNNTENTHILFTW